MRPILIAYDSTFMRTWLKYIIEPYEQYIVIAEARDGQEAIDQHKKHKTDIVLLDITMQKLVDQQH
ncbi:response regulator [Virgibacillus flavescens]|uniref:response regulator n=1 Tax=Virgibacillus flavescens TaxID=1611422 RepID=UPI003D345CCA